MSVAKPPINVLLAHPTNRWSRNGQSVEYIVLHYVGAVSSAEANAVYLNRDANLGWSAHFFTDETSIWQSVDLALWTEVALPGEIPVWRQPTGAQDAYQTGDKVHYPTAEDEIWISTADNNVWQPGVYGWEIYKEN